MYNKGYVVTDDATLEWIKQHPGTQPASPCFTAKTPFLIKQTYHTSIYDKGFVGMILWYDNWSKYWGSYELLYDGVHNISFGNPCKRK